MELNKVWNKRRQQKLLDMNKQGLGDDEIKKYFGSLLQYHPTRYNFTTNKMLNFINFKNEAYINKFKEIDYTYEQRLSFFYNFKTDYIIYFTVENVDYVIVLFYHEDKIKSYNILFTTKKQYDEYLDKIESFLEHNDVTDMDENFMNELKEILEGETKLNDPNQVMNALSYIIIDFYNKVLRKYFKNTILSIGNTKRKGKIEWYRHIIKNSFDNVKETEDISSIGEKIWYYNIEGIKLKK
mgnify:CR=1 FL=1